MKLLEEFTLMVLFKICYFSPRGAEKFFSSPFSYCVCVLVPQLCLTLCDPMDCSLPRSSVHGICQARILEWGAISYSKGSSQPRDWNRVSWNCIGRQILHHLSHQGSSFSYYVVYLLSGCLQISCLCLRDFLDWFRSTWPKLTQLSECWNYKFCHKWTLFNLILKFHHIIFKN